MSVPDLMAQSLLVMRSDAIITANRDGVICFWNPVGAVRDNSLRVPRSEALTLNDGFALLL